MHMAILEPDREIGEVLAFAATRRGYRAVRVDTFERMLGGLPFSPSVAVVAIDGESPVDAAVAERLREQYPGIIVLFTTEDAPAGVIMEAFRAGAQDVIRKPYFPYDVIAKAESWLAARGASPDAIDDIVRATDLTVDLAGYVATKNERQLNLTGLELRLLYCLGEHYPHLTPLDRLLSFGWKDDEEPDASLLKTHISHLRTKLRQAGGVELDIRARRSMGYILEPAGASIAVAS